MRNGTVGLTVFLALAAPFFPGRARACDPAFPQPHTIDPAQVGVDRTPPQLAQPTVGELHNNETGGGGCIGSGKCGWEHSARLTNLATDDTTPVDEIGYRVTLVAGDASGLTTGLSVPALASGDGSLLLFWDGDNDFDFTAQLIAIDAAGNESAPRTVQISSGDGGCSVGHRPASDGFALAVLALALASAAARPRRRQR
jgi:hypothetical protein